MSRPQPSARRMRSSRAACARVVVLVMLAGSCGDDDDGVNASGAQDAGAHGGRDSGRAVDVRSGLADDTAGRACSRDGDCPGGHCVKLAAPKTAYCSAPCTNAAQCGRGGSCVPSTDTDDGAEVKECLAACMTSDECREGYTCIGATRLAQFPVVGSCRPDQATDMLGDDVAGRACGADDECSGGRCASLDPLGASYPGNYCTGRCYDDADCGRGGVCLVQPDALDAGYCLQRCGSEADCARDGYRCWALGAGERLLHACFPGADPFPDHLTGKACAADADCAGRSGACMQSLPFLNFSNGEAYPAPGGYCTQPCSFDADCGAGAQCVSHSTHGALCFASCSEAQPCRTGYTCLAHLRDGDPSAEVCAPPMPGDADAGL